MTQRTPWIALLLSFFAPGAGHLYVGQATRFLVTAAIFICILQILIVGGYLSTFGGFVVGAITMIGFFLFTIADSVIIASSTPFPAQRWYMRWPIYAFYLLTSMLASGYLLTPETRSDVFGYRYAYVASDSMAPVIVEGDYLLADTKYYRKHPPTVGDIAIARDPSNNNDYVRRIKAVTDGSVWVSADNLISTHSPSGAFLNDIELPISSLQGRVTYIAFSKTWGRVGVNFAEVDLPNETNILSVTKPAPHITPR